MAQTGQSGPGSGKHGLALRTDLSPSKISVMAFGGQPASADYLRFCMQNDKAEKARQKRAKYFKHLVAFHGHLPLLQQLLRKPLKKLTKATNPSKAKWKEISKIACHAGESSSSSSSSVLFWFLTSFSLSLLHSVRRPTGDLAVAENPGI